MDFEELKKRVIQITYESAIMQDKIEPVGKTKDEIKEEFLTYLGEAIKILEQEDSEFRCSRGFRQILLKEAREYKDSGELELACLLYATWLEHFVNLIISVTCRLRGLDDQDTVNVIRNNQFIDKLGWLWRLLGLKPIEDSYKGRIFELIQRRNEFAHYKWRSRTEEDDQKNKEKIQSIIMSFEEVVTYLSNYFDKNILKDSKTKLEI